MSRVHTDIGPELRRLAQSILSGIDPAVRAAAAVASSAGVGKCQQVWCPVCALAALVSGEQHPLLTVVADHSVALMDVIRSMVDDMDRSGDRSEETPPQVDPSAVGLDSEPGTENVNGSNGVNPNGAGKTRYQPIPVTIQE